MTNGSCAPRRSGRGRGSWRVVDGHHRRRRSGSRLIDDAGGSVVTRSRSNSRSSRSWMISICSRPRKPQRKPKPSADGGLRLEGQGRIVELELFKRVAQVGIFGAVLRDRCRRTPWAAPCGSPAAARRRDRRASVTVSPTRAYRDTVLMDAVIVADLARRTARRWGRAGRAAHHRRIPPRRTPRRWPSCGCASPGRTPPSLTRI